MTHIYLCLCELIVLTYDIVDNVKVQCALQ